MKRAGSPFRLFSFRGGEEKSPYERNCITGLHTMLGASPTSCRRIIDAFYEPFLRSFMATASWKAQNGESWRASCRDIKLNIAFSISRTYTPVSLSVQIQRLNRSMEAT